MNGNGGDMQLPTQTEQRSHDVAEQRQNYNQQARQGKARQGKAGQGRAGQGRAGRTGHPKDMAEQSSRAAAGFFTCFYGPLGASVRPASSIGTLAGAHPRPVRLPDPIPPPGRRSRRCSSLRFEAFLSFSSVAVRLCAPSYFRYLTSMSACRIQDNGQPRDREYEATRWLRNHGNRFSSVLRGLSPPGARKNDSRREEDPIHSSQPTRALARGHSSLHCISNRRFQTWAPQHPYAVS
ncbi:hypothetical protein CMUS01_03204 [Colletotrichum musicola]|uniref:Uncharacterized protein n=1 Tax=Colletotrichum musicola TaxID=2175873 RepID=A0A8H6NTQ4_9PEZI|nr:hypothetical protein CMUS01_03204 [Colletotrichum musicola]